MKYGRIALIALIAAMGIAAGLVLLTAKGPSESRTEAVTIELANRNVEARGFPAWGSTNQSPTVRGTLPYVVACAVPADKTLRQAIELTGARVVGFFSPDAFQVEAGRESLRKLSADSRFAAAAEFQSGDKIDVRLSSLLRGGAEAVEVSIVSLVSEDMDAVRNYVVARGGELLKGCLNGSDSFRARIPAALIGELAKRGEVRWMEPFSRPRLLNDLAVEPAAMNVREVWDAHGLSGTNQVVSTSDSGIDTGDVATMHRDLADRVCGIGIAKDEDGNDCQAEDRNGHGTHTAGSIVGNGTMSDGAIRGVAWGAKLWAWFCQGEDGHIYTPEEYEDLFCPDPTNWPAFIHSASWGTDTSGTYDSQCADVDRFVWEHPEFLPVIANGNAGSGAGTVGSPAAAKNVLAVGATQNLRTSPSMGYADGNPKTTASYSSRGPCQDGRIKPDVAAPGTGVLSTRAYGCSYTFGVCTNANYAYDCGTSMATPLTAGAVALVREWLVDRCGFTNEPPSAALMKAVITGGAKGTSVPNNNQGWGRVDLEETLFPSNRAVRLVDRIPFAVGTNFTYIVETTNAAPLDVQLVWIDAPGSSGSKQSSARLINDLDLSVIALVDSEETVWSGNGGNAADERNSVESVRIAAAPVTKYRIVVSCSRILYDHTEGGAAALYIRGAFDPEATPDPPGTVAVTVSVDAGGAMAVVAPVMGVMRVQKGRRVEFAADEWAYEYSSAGTPFSRRAYRGFTGTGDAPASGSARNFSAVISNDTTVVWQYDETVSDYRFSYFAMIDGVGDYLVVDEWRAKDSTFTFKLPEEAALGDPYLYKGYYPATGHGRKYGTYEFRLGTVFYTQTDGEYGEYLVSGENGRLWDSVVITMDEGIDLWCYYFNAVENTTDGLPYWWYMRYLWGGAMMLGYDSSVAGDPDGDGFNNGREYAEGTDPVDDASFRFRIDGFTPTNMVFTGTVKGKLIIERSDSPSGEWKGILTNDARRTSVDNEMRLPKGGSSGFYRVIYAPESTDL